MFVGCGFTAQTHNPPQLRSTGMGTLLSRFSSAVFIRIASRLPDTLPFWIALISLKRKHATDLGGRLACSLPHSTLMVPFAEGDVTKCSLKNHSRYYSSNHKHTIFEHFKKEGRGGCFNTTANTIPSWQISLSLQCKSNAPLFAPLTWSGPIFFQATQIFDL